MSPRNCVRACELWWHEFEEFTLISRFKELENAIWSLFVLSTFRLLSSLTTTTTATKKKELSLQWVVLETDATLPF